MPRISELLSTWVKTPSLRGARILVASRCLPVAYPDLFRRLASEHDHVLLACPEAEPHMHYGKLATMIRSMRPNRVTVVTIDGSPHCLTLHASVNEAEYILGERFEHDHFVVVGGELRRVSPDAVRVARYLSIVDELLRRNPDVLKELEKHSLEYRAARRASSGGQR